MTDIVRIEDHSGDALKRLIDQWSASPRYQDLIRSIVDPCQAIEDNLIALLNLRSVETATGQQLDNLGEIVGQPRDGRTDEEYRLWIHARILANRSTGTPDDSIEIMKLIASEATTTLIEYYPAAYSVQAYGLTDDPHTVAEILQAVKPAGVHFWFESSSVVIGATFQMNEEPIAVLNLNDNLGFGDTTNPATGGHFAGVVEL